jgi:hypothetical protein
MANKRNRRKRNEPVNFWHSFVFKFSSRILLGLVVVVVFLTITQCTVKKPEAPTWNTTLIVPVINRTYGMQELIDKVDQSEIFVDSTGDVAFSIDRDLDTVRLAQSDLSTSDLSYNFSQTLGKVNIQPPSVPPSTISLGLLTAGLATDVGGGMVLVPPDTSFTANNDVVLNSFSWAEVDSGSVKITVSNHLGFDINQATVRLINTENVSSPDTIAMQSFANPILNNTTEFVTLPLNSQRVSSNLRVSVYCHTNNGGVVDPNGKSIETDVDFPGGVVVTSADAEIPGLEDILFSQDIGLNLDSGERIDSASLASGQISLDVTNNTPLDATIQITIPSLRNGGTQYSTSRNVPANQTISVSDNVSGYTMVPSSDSVHISAVASVPGSGGSFVTVDQADDFAVDANISGLTFASVSGVFDSTSANFDGISEALDVPDGFDNVGLVQAMLTLEVDNGVDLPGVLDITINGSNGKQINLSGNIAPRGTQVTSLSTITNSQVADFLSPLPDSIDVSGSIQFGNGVYVSTVTSSDFVAAKVSIYAPLEVKVDNAEVTDLKIEKSSIDQDNIDAITDHFVEGRFVYTITNHLPLGLTAVVMLDNDSLALYSTPTLTLDTLRADPAPVSLATGIANAETISTGEIFLDSVDVQILKHDSLFIRPVIFLTGSDTSGVKLTGDDYITINGRIEVEYRFDGKF